MASIINRKSGLREVRYVAGDGSRQAIRLGRCEKKTADDVLHHIERIIDAQRHDQPIRQSTVTWLSSLSDEFYTRLVNAGLVMARVIEADALSVGPMFTAYRARRTDLKNSTLLVFDQAKRHAVNFFGEKRSTDSITVGDAKDFRRYLAGQYSEAYTTKMIRTVQQVWRDAIDREVLVKNPWSKVKAGSKQNQSRQFFVTHEAIEKVIAQTPHPLWKLLIALSRYGGLRCPSEPAAMTWADIDWEHDRMTIRASKTEHHVNQGIRIVPIFAELRPYLQAAFDHAPAGTTRIFHDLRLVAASNTRTHMQRLVTRAGLTPWPRLFQNLRSSRQTELANKFPSHVVCKWIGNSEAIAKAHYLQVTDEHFEQAATGAPKSAPREAENGVSGGNAGTENLKNYPKIAISAKTGSDLVGPHGLEQAHKKQPNSKNRGDSAPKSAPPRRSKRNRRGYALPKAHERLNLIKLRKARLASKAGGQ